MPEGEVQLAEPPVLPEAATADFGSTLGFLPMALGGGMMALLFSVGGGSTSTYLISGVMGVSMMSMGASQLGRGGLARSRRIRAERRDYLRYLAQVRQQADEAAAEQRTALFWDNPDPRDLWSVAVGPRLWERRAGNEDFATVRFGLGVRRSALVFVPPQTKPVEDLEPLCAISLRRFIRTYQTASGVPVTLNLRNFTSVEFAGQADQALALIRAIVGQLVTLHSPDELQIAVLTDNAGLAEWDWVKWLPHNAHPSAEDAAGRLRLVATEHEALMDLLGPEFTERPEHEPGSVPGITEPLLVLVAHRCAIPASSRLLGAGVRNAVLLDATGVMTGGPGVLRLTTIKGEVTYATGPSTASAKADQLSPRAAGSLARALAPMRTSGAIDLSSKPLESDFELTTLLGIRNPRTFDVAARWRPRESLRARLQVPIGVTEDGEVVELDMKEAAQGGMGPHGLLIGATGSGKSELLRTLVVGLAATHSSEVLNFVLVDFKGGATFINMDRLPHTSAVITNLADELPLVDRMQDALNGELIRRQELLRESGYASLFDYEKARAAGSDLTPLPALLLVVDEFSELLAGKPEFVDLFVTIGRLGRSLGVHLLLASQRLDEGRIHRVEGHLSYRIALRTFSTMESRAVIGVPSAYELPSFPGSGYLKIDTTNLVRFKAAYVSGPCPPVADESAPGIGRADSGVVRFGLKQQPLPAVIPPPAREPVPAVPSSDDESLLDVLINRLANAGSPAHQVWLPPLGIAPSLDRLLPGIVPDPVRGLSALEYRAGGLLRVPLGIVDRPYEQSRELLVASLVGPDGHVAVVGAPQSGKSTMLRTLMLSLALTHTPEEVQFYCLDFSGGGLTSVAGLPHVGSVATRLDRDRTLRTIEEVAQIIEERERRFTSMGLESMTAYRAMRARGEIADQFGDVFLVIDGWGIFRQEYEEAEARVGEIAGRGLSFGVHVVITAMRWSEIRSRYRDLLGTRLELRLGDPMESAVAPRAARTVPMQPGRGLTKSGHHFLGALPRLDNRSSSDDLTGATRDAVSELSVFWTGDKAPSVRMLPAYLPTEQLPPPEGDARICLGLEEQRLQPIWHDFARTPHLLVFGDGETGKTNVLRLVAEAIMRRYQPSEVKILLGDPNRELHASVPEEFRAGYAIDAEALADLSRSATVSMTGRLPGADVTPEQLDKRDWWSGPQLFMLIDDYDLLAPGGSMGGPMAPLMQVLGQSPHIGLHLVIARSTSGAMRAMMDPLLRRLWELGSPAVLLSFPKEEGKFLGEAKPRALPAGRAQLVTRRNIRLIQTGIVSPGAGK
jgi:S-DNA-T family DNA segregation ATPase FtsK/SpoIIIE